MDDVIEIEKRLNLGFNGRDIQTTNCTTTQHIKKSQVVGNPWFKLIECHIFMGQMW